MNFGTAITLLIVGVMLFFALRSIVRGFRSGTSKCSECKKAGASACGHCQPAEDMVKRLDRGLDR